MAGLCYPQTIVEDACLVRVVKLCVHYALQQILGTNNIVTVLQWLKTTHSDVFFRFLFVDIIMLLLIQRQIQKYTIKLEIGYVEEKLNNKC